MKHRTYVRGILEVASVSLVAHLTSFWNIFLSKYPFTCIPRETFIKVATGLHGSQGATRLIAYQSSLVQLGNGFSPSYLQRSLFHTPRERPRTLATKLEKVCSGHALQGHGCSRMCAPLVYAWHQLEEIRRVEPGSGRANMFDNFSSVLASPLIFVETPPQRQS